MNRHNIMCRWSLASIAAFGTLAGACQGQSQKPAASNASADAVERAQMANDVPMERPEQRKTEHDKSDIFSRSQALPTTKALDDQADHGRFNGFDFYRDPLGAMKPGMTFDDVFKTLSASKSKVNATQRKLLETRYNLEPKLDAK
ncbi:MAG TPA: hypothetical protein VHZ24_19925, partial [Pirellulales bacterium]|nr:hypothetical protein [Pirellulales bacterium]